MGPHPHRRADPRGTVRGGPAAGRRAHPRRGRTTRAPTAAPPPAATGPWRPPFAQAYARTSPFGMRFHPIYHRWRLHSGADLVSLPEPGPVLAAHDGTVTAAGVARQLRQRRRHRPRRRHHHPLRPPRPHRPHHRSRGHPARRRPDRCRRLHRRQHRQPPPLRDPPQRRTRRPAPVHGRTRRTPGRQGRTHHSTHAPDPNRRPGRWSPGLPPAGQPRRNSLTTEPAAIPAPVKALYVAAARRYQLPWTLLAGIGMEETGHGATHATSPAGAQGLMQFMPGTFADLRGRRRPRRAGEHHQRRRQHLLRRELPHPVRRHHRSGRGASCPVRVQPRRLVRQRRPALRPRLRRRHRRHHGLHQLRSPNVAAKPTPTGIRRQRHRQGRTPCSRTDAPPPTRAPGRSR